MRNTRYLSFVMLLIWAHDLQAQEEKEASQKGSHQVTLMISHSNVLQGINEEGKRKWLIMPSWGLDYNYWLRNRWAIGLHNDLIVENFKVENKDEENVELERTRPIASILVTCFKPKKHSVFIVGLGGEFAKDENFFVTRIGYEYSCEIRNNWEIAGALNYDIKWHAYDTWTVGLGISKLFRKKEKK